MEVYFGPYEEHGESGYVQECWTGGCCHTGHIKAHLQAGMSENLIRNENENVGPRSQKGKHSQLFL